MRLLLDLHRENAKILETLGEELEFVAGLAKGEQPSLRYRMVIRSAFSHLEAMIWIIKQTALAYAESPTPTQEQFANEVSYALNDGGAIRESRAKTPFLPNLQFALSFASEVFGGAFELDKKAPEWNGLGDAIKLRDAITHPKSIAALEITQEQFSRSVNAVIWVMQHINNVLQAIQQHSEQIIRPITGTAMAAIAFAKDKIAAEDEVFAEEMFNCVEAIATQIHAESETGIWDQNAAIAKMHDEVLKFVNERPDLNKAIPDEAIEHLLSRVTEMFERNRIMPQLIGIDAQTLFSRLNDIKRGRVAEQDS